MPLQLTPRQQAVLTELATFIAAGKVPTMRELAATVGFASPSTILRHLKTLERLCLITHEPMKPRTIALTPTAYLILGCKTVVVTAEKAIAELGVCKSDFLIVEATDKATAGDYVYVVSPGETRILPYSATADTTVIGRVCAVVKTL